MSFILEFHAANPEAAAAVIDQEAAGGNNHLPAQIADYLKAGLTGCRPDQPVYIRARGHLGYSVTNGWQTTTADILVHTVAFREPKPTPDKAPGEQ